MNPPQAAVLAVRDTKDRPVVRGGKAVVTPMVSLTLVADHHVLDGAMVANSLRKVRGTL